MQLPPGRCLASRKSFSPPRPSPSDVARSVFEVSSRGWLLFIAMSFIWGVPYLMIKVAVEGVSVPVLVFARTAVGAAVLLPLALSSGIPAMIRRHWKALLGFSSFEIVAAWYLLSD